MSAFDIPEWRWEPWHPVSLVVLDGIARVVVDKEDDPEFVAPRPAGFTADIDRRQTSPGKPRRAARKVRIVNNGEAS